jgi:hypothetical protein
VGPSLAQFGLNALREKIFEGFGAATSPNLVVVPHQKSEPTLHHFGGAPSKLASTG